MAAYAIMFTMFLKMCQDEQEPQLKGRFIKVRLEVEKAYHLIATAQTKILSQMCPFSFLGFE